MYLLYFLLWMIFFGSITLESVLFGLGVAAAVFAFTCAFMDYSIKAEIALYKKFPGIIHYIYTLAVDIIHANMQVLRMIFTQKEKLEPALVHFDVDLKTPAARAFMADSITLTPGTITVSMSEDGYVVHCLDSSLAEGIDHSACEQELAELEKE